MDMRMISTPSSTTKDRYIRHPARENLFVIPYVKNRLVFAELAARAIEGGGFDLVLVDLPYFLNGEEFTDLPARFFPMVSSLVVSNREGKFVSIPFVPNDAACSAVAAVQARRDSGDLVEIKFIDDSNIINYHGCLNYPEPALKDDYFVFTDGLEAYFGGPFQELESAFEGVPDENRFYLEYRASRVAEHLNCFLKGGKRTLFLCEYRLWQQVMPMLDGKGAGSGVVFYGAFSELSAAIVLEDPYRLWSIGLMDDYPAVVLKFYECLKNGRLSEFDKADEINTIIKKGLSGEAYRPSLRKVLVFVRYLMKRLGAGLRIVPLPVAHLFDALHSCMGGATANEVARRFLEYPTEGVEEILDRLSIRKEQISYGNGLADVPDLHERVSMFGKPSSIFGPEKTDDRLGLVDRVRPYTTKKERQELGERYSGVTWELEPDYKIHEVVCEKAKEIADKKVRRENFRIKRSWGPMGAGIHMKATIASRANGEEAIYIMRRIPLSARGSRFEVGTPTVFYFADELKGHRYKLVHDGNITQRKIDMQNSRLITGKDPEPDYVYSLYATYEEETKMCDGHIYEQKLSSLAVLYHKYMGIKRHSGVTRRHRRFQCRTSPRWDSDLTGFTENELAAAWAVKYAEGSIIVVARKGWCPTERLKGFARARGVEIVTLPLSRFSDVLIDRLRISHNISTAMKKHPERDRIVARYLP